MKELDFSEYENYDYIPCGQCDEYEPQDLGGYKNGYCKLKGIACMYGGTCKLVNISKLMK